MPSADVASALFAMQKHDQAAHRFETIATVSTAATAKQRAGILAQASHAWVMHGSYERALGAIDVAIFQVPDASDLHADRGQVLGLLGGNREVLAAFDRYLAARPDDIDILVCRGAVKRLPGQLRAARADFDQGLTLKPDHNEALPERGLVFRQQGQIDAVRNNLVAAALAAGQESRKTL